MHGACGGFHAFVAQLGNLQLRCGKQTQSSGDGCHHEQRFRAGSLRQVHSQKGADSRSERDGQHIVAHAFALAIVGHKGRYDGAD